MITPCPGIYTRLPKSLTTLSFRLFLSDYTGICT